MTAVHLSRIGYRAYIDGLRAIAVLSVLMFHAELGFSGGYAGVDVFFVISGYLITRLILKDLDAHKFRMVDFWERRIRRIFPALAVVVATSLVAGWFILMPVDFQSLAVSSIAQAFMAANLYFWQNTGYFDASVNAKPLLHTWSLAVEEQFYLILPFALIFLKRWTRPALARVLLIGGVASFVLCVAMSYLDATSNFYLLPTRAWELLSGAYLATKNLHGDHRRKLPELVSLAGLLAIIYSVVFYNEGTRFPGVAALLPCLGTVAVIWANEKQPTTVGSLLSTRPLVFVGLISYSLYLYHWPVLVFAKYWYIHPLTHLQGSMLLLLSAVLATLSWKFVETPFRTRALCPTRGRMVSFAAAAMTVILLASAVIRGAKGVPSRIGEDALQYTEASLTDYHRVQEQCYLVGMSEVRAAKFITLGDAAAAAATGQKPPRVLVWGDSHAVAIIPVLDSLATQHHAAGAAAVHAGTPPLLGYSRPDSDNKLVNAVAFNNAVLDYVRSSRVENVILAGKWASYQPTQEVRKGLLETLSALENTPTKVWLLRQVPKPTSHVPHSLTATVFRGRDPETFGVLPTDHHQQQEQEDIIFADIQSRFPKVTILDPTSRFEIKNHVYQVLTNGELLYSDESHLTARGAHLLRPLFEPIFQGSTWR